MPRFYMHLLNKNGWIEDSEGGDYLDLEHARREAVIAAREIMSDRLMSGKPVDSSRFEVADEAGTILVTVPFDEILKI